ncbi:transposase [Gallintestinimicrobium sp.]|uniref:transposase n=1 Tax=Gallintestinimicrobium sp. TaxID=2981655 RepID=UPI003994ED14
MDNRYNRHNRRKYSLKVHIVLVTKYRKQLLKDSIADDVNDIANTYGTNMVRFCLNSIGRKKIFWSDGYFACSIGEVSSTTIQKYIENQG